MKALFGSTVLLVIWEDLHTQNGLGEGAADASTARKIVPDWPIVRRLKSRKSIHKARPVYKSTKGRIRRHLDEILCRQSQSQVDSLVAGCVFAGSWDFDCGRN